MKIAAVFALCLATACSTAVSERGCHGTVNREIAKYGVTPDQITKTVVSSDTDAGDDGHTVGHTYWMSLKSCGSGYLIVDTNTFCYVQQVYTTGACEVKGVPHY